MWVYHCHVHDNSVSPSSKPTSKNQKSGSFSEDNSQSDESSETGGLMSDNEDVAPYMDALLDNLEKKKNVEVEGQLVVVSNDPSKTAPLATDVLGTNKQLLDQSEKLAALKNSGLIPRCQQQSREV